MYLRCASYRPLSSDAHDTPLRSTLWSGMRIRLYDDRGEYVCQYRVLYRQIFLKRETWQDYNYEKRRSCLLCFYHYSHHSFCVFSIRYCELLILTVSSQLARICSRDACRYYTWGTCIYSHRCKYTGFRDLRPHYDPPRSYSPY